MKIFTYCFLILLFTFNAFSQIEVEQKNGNQSQGIIVTNNNDFIEIRTFDGVTKRIQRNDIKKITPLQSKILLLSGKSIQAYISLMDDKYIYLKPQNIINSDEVKYERKEVLDFQLSESFSNENITFGATYGTPGGINLTGGYENGNWGFRGCFGAMPWAEIYGTQFNFQYNIYTSRNLETGFSLATGYFVDDESDYLYLGPMYHINAYGAFFEFGLGFGRSTYFTNPQILFQIGYIHRFN